MTTPPISTGAIARAMVLLTWVGAANHDATPEQRAQLREVIRVLRDDSVPTAKAYEQVIRETAAVMGPDWRPTGEWAAQIESLMRDTAGGTEG